MKDAIQMTETDQVAVGADASIGPLEVVLLDDNKFDLRRLERVLSEMQIDVRVHTCCTLPEFKQVLDTDIYDICLIDHHLSGGASSEDAIETLRAHNLNGYVPAVLISGTVDPSVIVKSIQSGFANFVDKDALNVSRLCKVVAEALDDASQDGYSSKKKHKLLTRILREVADTYANSTRPHLTDIYRKVDFMRACLAHKQLPDPAALDDIEESCFRIWRFMDAYPNHGLAIDNS